MEMLWRPFNSRSLPIFRGVPGCLYFVKTPGSAMLMFRARAWAMRDALPEALKGLGIREEIQDMEPIPSAVEMPKRLSESKPQAEKNPEPLKEDED